MKKLYLAALLTLLSASGAVAAPAGVPEKDVVAGDAINDANDAYDDEVDPIEPINRSITHFNDAVDTVIYKPVARSYRYVVPQWGRNRVSNVLYNLGEPLTVVNSGLQGDPENTFTSLWRFILNSTVGILGMFDVAESFGLKPRQEDFGQTFAVWGWKSSSYLVLPFLGPSTLRDALGLGVEFFADPVNIAATDSQRIARYVADAIDQRTHLLPVTDEIERTSLDKYASYRSIYLQERNTNVENGKLTPAY